MHLNFFNCFREFFLFFANGKFLQNPKIVQNASKKFFYILYSLANFKNSLSLDIFSEDLQFFNKYSWRTK